jgi:hypothetical protein
MTQLNNTDLEIENLKNQISRMSDQEVGTLNQRALITLLFVYSDGSNEFSDKDISAESDLAFYSG